MKKMSTLGKVLLGGGIAAAVAGVACAIFGKDKNSDEENYVASEEESTEDEE